MEKSRQKEIVELAKELFKQSYSCQAGDEIIHRNAVHALSSAIAFYDYIDKRVKTKSFFKYLLGMK